MDPLDVVGALLGTAIAFSPLVILAYRDSGPPAGQHGLLASLNDTLARTAPLIILVALHAAIAVGAFLLTWTHWQYLRAGSDHQGWWFYIWVTLFFSVSHASLVARATRTSPSVLASRTILLLLGAFCSAFLLPYFLRGSGYRVFDDYSRIIIPAMAAAWVVLIGIRVFTHVRTASHRRSSAGADSRSDSALTLLRRREAELRSSLEEQERKLSRAADERTRLDEELRRGQDRETELAGSLEQHEERLAGAEVEQNRLHQELQRAQAREEQLRTLLEETRATQSQAANAAAEERARMARELEEARAREQDLIARMEKLSVVITFLKRRDDRKPARSSGTPFDKLIDADSYYAGILGVRGRISPDAVRERHRELVLQNHPDRVEALDPAIRAFAEIRMKEMNEAYQYFKKKFRI